MIFKDLEGIGVDLQFMSIIILKIIFFLFLAINLLCD